MLEAPDRQPLQGAHDTRFTHALVRDVLEVLEAHGYHRPPGPRRPGGRYDRATHAATGALVALVGVFEGGDPS